MRTIQLKDQNEHYEFEHGCVIVRNEYSQATRQTMPKLYVQVIDAYRYQWEWTLQFRHRPGDSKDLYWESHIYRHPGQRQIKELTPAVAKRLWDRFMELVRNYPTLLFNESNVGRRDRPRHEGFIHFGISLLSGADPSCKLLG